MADVSVENCQLGRRYLLVSRRRQLVSHSKFKLKLKLNDIKQRERETETENDIRNRV